MSTQPVSQSAEATAHLKNVYEQSLAMLSEDGESVGKKRGVSKPSVPIARSCVPLHVDPAFLQKRAIDDAAKALATLWKVPGKKISFSR